jgi:hypothetical protein
MYTCIFFSIKLYGHPLSKRVTVTQMYICIHLPSLAQSSMVTPQKRSTVTQMYICIHLPFLAYSSKYSTTPEQCQNISQRQSNAKYTTTSEQCQNIIENT